MQKCGGPGSNEGTVESLNRFGHPELIETLGAERAFWCPSNRASSTKIRFRVSWHGGKRHQTGQGERANPVSATRELHGEIMDPEHVALAWCAFCWSDHILYCEKRRWAHCIPTCISACVSPTSNACSMGEERSWTWKRAKRRFRSQTSF